MNFEFTISVIIPCQNHTDELRRCLAALKGQQPFIDHEIIVVDSTPDDERLSKIRAAFPHVRHVKGHKPLLAGEARNLGVKFARGRYLAFIDADCLPEHDWLHVVRKVLDKGYLFVGGPVLDCLPYHPIAAADNLLQLPDFTSYRPSGIASHLPGGNMATSRAAFHAIGGFSAGIAVGEDTLLSSAAAKRWPRKVYFSNAMRVCHYGRERMKDFLFHQRQFGYFRAVFGLHVSALYLRLGKSIVFSCLFALRRIGYFVFRALQWRPISLLWIIVHLPFLLLGLTAWAIGFWKGCRARKNQARMQSKESIV
jgi:GT2 family glycosyltransferase